MLFHFRCPKCDMKYRARPDQGGRLGRCVECETVLRVPMVDQNLVAETPEDIVTATTVDVKGDTAFTFIRKVLGLKPAA